MAIILKRLFWILAILPVGFTWGQSMHEPAKTLFSLKGHLYAPLSLLEKPFPELKRYSLWYARMFTLEGEIGLTARKSLGIMIGFRKFSDSALMESAVDYYGLRATGYFRHYFVNQSGKALHGWYVMPMLIFDKGEFEAYDDAFFAHEISHAVSLGTTFGRQWLIGKHFVFDAGLGVVLGIQVESPHYGGDAAYLSAMDLAGRKLGPWESKNGNYCFSGIGFTAQFAAGWRF